jgi:hypothetical protein
MALDSGYYYVTLDGDNFFRPDLSAVEVNPTTDTGFISEKLIAKVITQNGTITQHWQKKSTDKHCDLFFARVDKTTADWLVGLDEADYESYVYTDIYNASHNVVIEFLSVERITQRDVDGFRVSLTLKKV